jgi:hypothetical protein
MPIDKFHVVLKPTAIENRCGYEVNYKSMVDADCVKVARGVAPETPHQAVLIATVVDASGATCTIERPCISDGGTS